MNTTSEPALQAFFLEPAHDLFHIWQTLRMREKTYPGDMSREQFEQIRPILEQARKCTK